jgi:hypothetical protein
VRILHVPDSRGNRVVEFFVRLLLDSFRTQILRFDFHVGVAIAVTICTVAAQAPRLVRRLRLVCGASRRCCYYAQSEKKNHRAHIALQYSAILLRSHRRSDSISSIPGNTLRRNVHLNQENASILYLLGNIRDHVGSHLVSGHCLINALPGQVGFSTNMYSKSTYQDLVNSQPEVPL